jgi:hypothetical protein
MKEVPSPAGAATRLPDLTSESDEDLIQMMGWDSSASDREIARAAWGAFFVRHRKLVLWLCRGSPDPPNLTGEVFRQVREIAKDFDPRPMREAADEREKRKILCAWLGAIARRIRQQEYLTTASFGKIVEPAVLQQVEDKKCSDPTDALAGKYKASVERVRQLVDSLLSEKEREVLLVSMQWYNPEHRRCYVPPGVLNELRIRLNTTADNIRRLRKTAFDRIKASLEAERNGSPADL